SLPLSRPLRARWRCHAQPEPRFARSPARQGSERNPDADSPASTEKGIPMPGSFKMLCCAVASIAAPLAAQAQAAQCMNRDALVAALEQRYAEGLLGRGLQSEQQLIEVFMSPDGESWTILQTYPNGMSCIVASGTDWLPEEAVELAGVPS